MPSANGTFAFDGAQYLGWSTSIEAGVRVRRVVGGRKALAHKFPWQVPSLIPKIIENPLGNLCKVNFEK